MGHSRTSLNIVALLAALFISIPACDKSADFGESLAVTQRMDIGDEPAYSPDRKVTIPGDMSFNIADAQRESANGGEASSGADPAGSAFCKASVTDAGQAWAEFTIGRVISNDTESEHPVTVSLQTEFAFEVSQTDDTEDGVPERAILKFVIKDANRRIIERSTLIDPLAVRSSGSGSAKLTRSFDVVLAPRTAYHLLLAGRVEADALKASNDAAAIDVKQFSLTVEPKARESSAS